MVQCYEFKYNKTWRTARNTEEKRAVAGIAFAVYRFFAPDYLEDFEEDFDDDFDDYFEDEEE